MTLFLLLTFAFSKYWLQLQLTLCVCGCVGALQALPAHYIFIELQILVNVTKFLMIVTFGCFLWIITGGQSVFNLIDNWKYMNCHLRNFFFLHPRKTYIIAISDCQDCNQNTNLMACVSMWWKADDIYQPLSHINYTHRGMCSTSMIMLPRSCLTPVGDSAHPRAMGRFHYRMTMPLHLKVNDKRGLSKQLNGTLIYLLKWPCLCCRPHGVN